MIRCADCNEIVQYALYQMHLLKHKSCDHCDIKLQSWNEIREHYYEKCSKYVVNCDSCEFSFNRDDYGLHDCIEHYNLRMIEVVLYMATIFL